jgi:homoserine kinase
MQAALEAGAHGAFLSGAGSSIMAITSGMRQGQKKTRAWFVNSNLECGYGQQD